MWLVDFFWKSLLTATRVLWINAWSSLMARYIERAAYISSQVLNPKNENSQACSSFIHSKSAELRRRKFNFWLLFIPCLPSWVEWCMWLCVSWVNRYGSGKAFTFHLRQKIFFKSSRIVMMWHAAVLHHYDLLRHEAFDAHTHISHTDLIV